MTNEEVRNRIQNATGVHDELLTMVKMVWPHLKILWHGKDNYAGGSDRSKKEREEDRRRDGKITSRNGREWCLEIP